MGGTFGGVLALVAFTTTVARGVIYTGSCESTLKAAIVSLVAFAALGYALGRTAEWTIDDSVRSRFRAEQDGNVDVPGEGT